MYSRTSARPTGAAYGRSQRTSAESYGALLNVNTVSQLIDIHALRLKVESQSLQVLLSDEQRIPAEFSDLKLQVEAALVGHKTWSFCGPGVVRLVRPKA